MAGAVKLLKWWPNPKLCSTAPQFSKVFTNRCLHRSTNLTPSHLYHNCSQWCSNHITDIPVLFRQLNPERCKNSEKLLKSTRPLNLLNCFPRTLFFGKRDDNQKKKKKRVPKLILLQNPLTWLMIKIDFGVLRTVWDPNFAEKDFKFGTKQAVSKVTNVISGGKFEDLNGLLTKAARLSLLRELERNWSGRQRTLLALNRDDIQISSPRKVYFIRIADKKFCDVDMAFLALKWVPINTIEALIFTEIFARFHREYTPHCIPEWTIAYFKITRFEVLRRNPIT